MTARRIIQLTLLLALTGIFTLAGSSTARADVTYAYRGNAFTEFHLSYACPPVCGITVSFTVAQPLAANLPFQSLFTPISYTITDGLNTFTEHSPRPCGFEVSTDSNGNISTWFIECDAGPPGPLSHVLYTCGTGHCPPSVAFYDWTTDVAPDGSVTNFADNINSPGTWSQGPAAPPSQAVLYDNGTNGSPPSPLGGALTINLGLAVTDSFVITTPSIVTGVGFWTAAFPGATPLTVDWRITSSAFSGSTLAQGTASVNYKFLYNPGNYYDIGSDIILLPSVGLTPGTYWLQLENASVTGGQPCCGDVNPPNALYWLIDKGPSQAFQTVTGAQPSESFEVFGTPTVPPCTFSLSPTGQTFGAQGGPGSFLVTTTPTCQWSVTSIPSWVTLPFLNPHVVLPPDNSGKVHVPVNFIVGVNQGSTARMGSIVAAGQQFQITQQGVASTCTFSISPSHTTFDDTGGSVRVVVTAPESTNCQWTAVSNVSWLTVTAGATGSGTGAVTLHAAVNTGGPRSGTATIAGQTFSVTQGGGSCGALDVTLQMPVVIGGLTWIPPTSTLYGEQITLRNASTSVIHGPVYLALIGEPTHIQPDPNGWFNTALVSQPPLTYCFSVQGDYLQPVWSGNLQAGQTVSVYLTWVRDIFAASPSFTYRVLSGQPTR